VLSKVRRQCARWFAVFCRSARASRVAPLAQVSTAPFDVSGALFNADVGNAATVIIIMLVAVGWVIAVIERRNPHLGSVSRGSYWGLMMFLNAADEGPNSVRFAGSAARRSVQADAMHCRASLAAHGSHSEDHLAHE
jgi:hypothetical protein